jgi:4-hydroxyphenylacetate 3-monooxygenase
MVKIVQLLGAGGAALPPYQAGLEEPMSEVIAKYDRGVSVPVDERMQLFRLAWDVVGDCFGIRQQLYEADVPADVVRTMAGDYQGYDLQGAVARAQAFLTSSETIPIQ